MSAPTLDRPGAAPSSPPPGPPTAAAPTPARTPTGSGAAAFGARSAAGRTFRTWLGLALGLTPLFMLISDARWYVVGIGATIVTVGPAWALRLWRPERPPRVWQLLPGLILLPFYLTAVCVPTGAMAGLIPTKMTWTQLSLLHEELVDTIAKSTAPIDSTPGVRLALAALLGVGIVMVDVLCTVLEAPAMVGLVLLPVYVLAGGTVRQPVSLWWFVLAGVGYLLILSTTGPEAKPWGRTIGRRPPGAPPSLVSGRTIGIVALLAAVVLPLVSGGTGSNVIADALHTGPGGDGSGSGAGGVTQLASLKGSLTRSTPIDLMSVKVPAGAPVEPFYLRQSVLDVFTGDGWVPAGNRVDAFEVAAQGLPQSPARPSISSYDFKADINISGLDGRAVTFADTTGVGGLPNGSEWDATHGTFTNADVDDGTRYTVFVAQPNPTPAEIARANDVLPQELPDLYRAVPGRIDPFVVRETNRVIGGETNPYLKAKALSDYFTTAANGFRYNIDVPEGDSDDDVVNFLRNKQGFCQQYAATMAVMLRLANVPSRVVVGYTHVAADDTGTFTVSTRDAHAWVEAYIGGLGWLSFDPTPLTGSDAARAVDLPYLSPGGTSPTGGPSGTAAVPTPTDSSAVGPGQANGDDGGLSAIEDPLAVAAPDHTGRWVALWVALGVVLLLLLTPAVLRIGRRQRARGVRGPDAAEARFDELRDTCVDLGLDWSSARSPRAVATWLAGHGLPEGMARPLVAAVEQSRYGRTPPAADAATLDAVVARSTAALRRHTRPVDRLRARWWPRSVTLDIRRRTRARVDGVRDAFTSWSNRANTSSRTYGGLRRGR